MGFFEKCKHRNKQSYYNLSPKDYNKNKTKPEDIKYYKAYKEALDFGLNDPEVKNIGITGSYGSGKSSVIMSYLEARKRNLLLKFKNTKYISISLAHFSTLTGNDLIRKEQGDGYNSNIDNILESKIVNQLVHQIKSKKIPKANFTAKNNPSKLKIILWSSCLLHFIIYGLLNFNGLEKHVLSLFKLPPTDFWHFLGTLIFISSSFFFIFNLIKLVFYHKFSSKFSFQSNGITVNLEEKSLNSISYFDNFLDDVVYLFDYSGNDIVVFEDLDRFPDYSIFEKLREINILVNYRRKQRRIWNKNKLVFIYVVKDDIFSNNSADNMTIDPSNERTKFFDFIIPIVPVISSSNAYDYLKQLLQNSSEGVDSAESSNGVNGSEGVDSAESSNGVNGSEGVDSAESSNGVNGSEGIDNVGSSNAVNSDVSSDTDKKCDKIDEEFEKRIYQLSLFINDFRTLKNIVNEYTLYKKIQIDNNKEIGLDNKTLFSLIVYKNLNIDDFIKLSKSEGDLYNKLKENME